MFKGYERIPKENEKPSLVYLSYGDTDNWCSEIGFDIFRT